MPAADVPLRGDGDDTTRSWRSISIAAQGAVWAFFFLILRIFAVSGYDWDTAFLVSTTVGLDDGLALVFGSLMAGRVLTAVLMLGVLPLLMAAFFRGPRQHRLVVALLLALSTATLAALTVSLNSRWLPAGIAIELSLLGVLHRWPLRGVAREAWRQVLARVGWIVGGAVLLLAALVQTPWVPQERIETTDGTVTGYVLSVDPGYLNVLTDDQAFVIILTSDVVSRF